MCVNFNNTTPPFIHIIKLPSLFNKDTGKNRSVSGMILKYSSLYIVVRQNCRIVLNYSKLSTESVSKEFPGVENLLRFTFLYC